MKMKAFRSLVVLTLCQMLVMVNVWAGDSKARSPITEFRLPDSLSSPYAIGVDGDSRVWFTEKIGRNLAMFDPQDERFEVYPLPDSWGKVGPSQFAITNAGDIWFTIRRWAEDIAQTNVLGKFSPSTMSFERFVISLDASPQEIVVDDNGILWLLAADTNKLFRVNPVDAKVISYEIPTANSNPQGLTIGLEGDVWFSEPNANQIGRFASRSGFFEEHEIPTAFSNPGDIAVDREGKIWFVERATNRLGVYYPDRNRFDEALVPTINALPHAIEADGLGRLWFLEYRGNKVGVFNPVMASFHEFDIPRYNSQPGELAIDAKNSLVWFTQSNSESSQLAMLSVNLAGLPSSGDAAVAKTEAAARVTSSQPAPWNSTLFIILAIIAAVVGTGIWVTVKPGEVG
jgi:virginiamycin B lyase